MKQIKFIAFGLVFGIAGFLIGIGASDEPIFNSASGLEQNSAETCSIGDILDEQEQKVSIMIDTGDDLLGFSDALAQDTVDTVYSVLFRLAGQNEALTVDVIDYGSLGMFVNSINGKASGSDNKYWQYWVNNEYGQVSADTKTLQQGDVIFWKFTSSRFKNF